MEAQGEGHTVRGGRTEGRAPRRRQGKRKEHSTEYEAQLDWLGALLAPFGLSLDLARRKRLVAFAQEVASWSKRVNLVSRREIQFLIRKHVAPSLAPLLLAEPQEEPLWADLGTGAGFPGMVLHLWDPARPMVLIESQLRKCIFLCHVCSLLNLPQLHIVRARAEELARNPNGKRYGVVSARAVAPLPKLLHHASGLLLPSGLLLAFAGPQWRSELAGAQSTLRKLGFRCEQALAIPWCAGQLLSLRFHGDVGKVRGPGPHFSPVSSPQSPLEPEP